MSYRILADAVLLLHFGFVAFVAAGALLVWRWPPLAWLHLPALAWGAYAVLAGAICPLTPLENALRAAGGRRVYDASFIEHYLLPLVYPGFVQGDAGRVWQIGLGVALVAFNAVVYALLARRRGLYENRGDDTANEEARH
jgi:Protein of Unknown function (DUF2784)